MKIYADFGYGYVLKEFMFIEANLYDVTFNDSMIDLETLFSLVNKKTVHTQIIFVAAFMFKTKLRLRHVSI